MNYEIDLFHIEISGCTRYTNTSERQRESEILLERLQISVSSFPRNEEDNLGLRI